MFLSECPSILLMGQSSHAHEPGSSSNFTFGMSFQLWLKIVTVVQHLINAQPLGRRVPTLKLGIRSIVSERSFWLVPGRAQSRCYELRFRICLIDQGESEFTHGMQVPHTNPIVPCHNHDTILHRRVFKDRA